MRLRTATTLLLVLALAILTVSPALASDSGSYKTKGGDLVEWIFIPPSPDNPNGTFHWTHTCHHCGNVIKGTGTPPGWHNQ